MNPNTPDHDDFSRPFAAAPRQPAFHSARHRTPAATAIELLNSLLGATIINSRVDAITVVDMAGQIIAVNPTFTKTWGYTIEELKGKSPRMLYADEENGREPDHQGNLSWLTAEPGQVLPIHYRRRDGKTFLGETSVTCVRDPDNAPIGYVAVTRDVTPRKQSPPAHRGANEDLRRENKKLEKRITTLTAELEEANAGLRVLLKRLEQGQKESRKQILTYLHEQFGPSLEKLQKTKLSPTQKSCVSTLAANLEELLSPLHRTLSLAMQRLTPTEIKIADFILRDKSTKDIAAAMHLSPWTVNVHRRNIRKKCGITNKKINLRTALESLLG